MTDTKEPLFALYQLVRRRGEEEVGKVTGRIVKPQGVLYQISYNGVVRTVYESALLDASRSTRFNGKDK